nr:hypothetical protein BaRGS_008822 [Batillaria attramentaria]
MASFSCSTQHQYGVFSTDVDDYFVEPLWNHTSLLGQEGHPHLVYSRSSIKSSEFRAHCGVSVSRERHVETLVVIDKKMVDYYEQHHDVRHPEGITAYVLTIMNIVAKLYHDPSIGNAINIVVTRLIIFTGDKVGLAPVEGMCEKDRSCSINQDIGLASAFIIAHEIGHNFGMHHDGASNTCGLPGHEPARIMAARLTKDTSPFQWSSCSRNYITDFLE